MVIVPPAQDNSVILNALDFAYKDGIVRGKCRDTENLMSSPPAEKPIDP